ncbi:MAG: hypothetical protein K6T66_05685 [Peptococcaceae bacterium]|nr:hypothetical protein [Peptococcaceae bacterium]
MKVILTADAGGAALAGSLGLVVVVVDVIDFSTSMEAAIDEGAAAVFGAAPDGAGTPVTVNPYRIGTMAGMKALQAGTGVVVLAEPRAGGDEERRSGVSRAVAGVRSTGAEVVAVIPNLGAETPRLADLGGKVVLGATGSGGAAFDAAVCAGAPAVLTGTVARTMKKSGFASAEDAAGRAAAEARRLGTGIAVAAASGNSLEDVLAADYIYKTILRAVRRPGPRAPR